MCIRTAVDSCAVISLHRERRSVTDRLTAGRAFLNCHSSLSVGAHGTKHAPLQECSPQTLRSKPPQPMLQTQPSCSWSIRHFPAGLLFYFLFFDDDDNDDERLQTVLCVSQFLFGCLNCRSGRGFITPKRRTEIAFSKM